MSLITGGSWGDDLAESVWRVTDPRRFVRGEELYEQDGVLECTFRPGSVTGIVVDSSDNRPRLSVDPLSEPQLALLLTALHRPPSDHHGHHGLFAMLEAALFARGVSLGPSFVPPMVFCDCRDREDFCQHVVALTLHLADIIDDSPWEWLRLRGLDLDLPGDTARRPHRPPPPAPEPEPTLDDELETYWSGSGAALPAPAVVPRPAHRERDRELLVDALRPLFAVRGRSRARSTALAAETAQGLELLYEEFAESEEVTADADTEGS